MALNSPGVEVKVIDESFYVPAEPGTKPLIIVATEQNKKNGSGTGTAVGTLASNAGKPYLLTSTRDLSDIFGTPKFYTDSNNNPIHGDERNEYGLQAAYSYLGVSNSAWVVRADLDLSELTPSTIAPNSNPDEGQYWLNTKDTHFGIFEWNGSDPTVSGGQKFTNKIPTVITDPTQVDGNGAPLGAIGKIGDYAVVSVTATNRIFYRTKSKDTPWVLLGSSEWVSSNPAVQGTKIEPTLLHNDSLYINTATRFTNGFTTGIEVKVPVAPDESLDGLVSEINNSLNNWGVSAANVNGRLELYGDSTVGYIIIGKGTSTLIDVNKASDSKLGIKAGNYYTPKLSIQPHTNVPRYKKLDNTNTINGFPSSSVWIKTTNVNSGAHWVVKVWDATTKDWKIVLAPVYASNQESIYGLDRAGGGKNIPRGTVYVRFNVEESLNPLATFSLFRRELPSPTTVISEVISAGTFTNGIIYGMAISESTVGSSNLSGITNVPFIATGTTNDSTIFANAINAAGFSHIVASVNSRNQLIINHDIGGDFRITGDFGATTISGVSVSNTLEFNDVPSHTSGTGSGATFNIRKSGSGSTYANHTQIIITSLGNYGYKPGDQITIYGSDIGGDAGTNDLTFILSDTLDLLGYTFYDITNNGGTNNLQFSAIYDWSMYTASNWKPLKIKASNIVPSQIPLNGTLWYDPSHSVDIMIHNGTTWVGYLDIDSPYYSSDTTKQTDPNGPIISATKPTAQSDGSELINGDLWIDTGDIENYPALYKFDGYNLKWISVDNTDQTTEEGILFGDARYNLTGRTSDPADISDLLYSNFLDPDAPDPDLYPRGMLLFNTRRSGNNVKRFVRNYIDPNGTNIRYNDESMSESGTPGTPGYIPPYYPHRWVNESGNAADGHGLFGRHAQRKVVVGKLKSLVDTNQLIRDQEIRKFNLLACPGYTELIQNMVNLNIDRKQTAFVIGDSPMRLPSDATSINDWGKNAKSVNDNGEDGLFSTDEYLGVYYPSGYTTDNAGNAIVVPASHMVLRSIAISDGVSFPWFAPAGTRRGKVSNATSIGYIDSSTNEWQSISLNEGQRDTLYSVGVNPITYLTGSGIVIFGQKTRAPNASSLDRVNVARLVVYLRGQLSALAKPYIFEPNDKITRDELKSAAESIMLELVGQRGIYDYLVVCDESNNTPSRIDRNELYLDIAIEPVKSVEFIYIPLRLKNTGEIAGLGK